MSDQQITIRSGAGCELELVRLAALDSGRPLEGAVLVAEAGGRVRAAVSLEDGREVADPFYASAPLVELLRVHAQQHEERPRRGLALRLGRVRPAFSRPQ